MKFSNIAKGTRAESEPVEVPRFDFSVIMRPIVGTEYEAAIAWARNRAEAKGSKSPEMGDPIYDLSLMAAIVAAGSVDPDSPPEAREPSFESGEDLLRDMHPEEIVYLHERHEAWQDECSPFTRKRGDGDMLQLAREVAGPNGRATFMRLSPSTRLAFSLSTAQTLVEHLDSLTTKSASTSGSSGTSTPSAKRRTPSGKRPKSARSRPPRK